MELDDDQYDLKLIECKEIEVLENQRERLLSVVLQGVLIKCYACLCSQENSTVLEYLK